MPTRQATRRASRSPPRRRRAKSPAPKTSTPEQHQLVCFPGGGTFFWWQLGAATELRRLFNLSGVELPGFSAGALAAVLSVCEVDPDEAHRVAFDLAEGANVFRNPLGLAFKWGRLVEAWLRSLLPEDAASRCDGAATIVLTAFAPWPRVARARRFSSREQLISCLMASTHIPYFMDGKFARSLPRDDLQLDGTNTSTSSAAGRGSSRCASVAEKPIVRAADGGFLEFFGRTTSHDLLTGFKAAGASSSSTDDAATTTAILLDPLRDASFMAACNAHGWSMLKPYGTEHFITYGRDYVRSQLAMGLAGELAPLIKQGRLLERLSPSPPPAPAPAAEEGFLLPPPLLRRRSSILRAGRAGMKAYAIKAIVLLVLALAPLVAAALYLYRDFVIG